MPNETTVMVTIIAMAAATYVTRAGGLWLMRRMTPSPFIAACLSHLPGTLPIAIVAPLLFKGSPAEFAAAGVTALVMANTGNLLITLIAGVGLVWLLRAVG